MCVIYHNTYFQKQQRPERGILHPDSWTFVFLWCDYSVSRLFLYYWVLPKDSGCVPSVFPELGTIPNT